METKLDKLKRYIRTNFDTQEEFAKAIGLTRQGIAYVLRTSKSKGGELSPDFLMRLEHRKINIFDPDEKYTAPAAAHDTDVNMQSDWKTELIQSQKETINLQKQIIDNLTSRLRQYEHDVGKAGAR